MQQSIYIILENGRVFEGEAFGAKGEAVGEIIFTTGMTGYLETLTDPSYYGQIVVQTFPLIGNYGVIPSDYESQSPRLKAYIVREWCQNPSNYRCEGDLDGFLKAQNIIGVCGVDTRELTKIIREHGVMNAKITVEADNLAKIAEEIKSYKIVDAVRSVSSSKVSEVKTDEAAYKVVLWDFGLKENIRRELTKRRCEVITAPAATTAEEIIALMPDGIMLSNGPGDPAENTNIINEIKELCKVKIPVFGICLGHQLLALAQGAKTSKLKYGHRGSNQPVKDLATGRVHITSQNHGYAVEIDSIPPHGRLRLLNANDGTCEGIEYLNMPAFSVQFHPEAAAGPLDTNYLFDQFIELMKGERAHAAKSGN